MSKLINTFTDSMLARTALLGEVLPSLDALTFCKVVDGFLEVLSTEQYVYLCRTKEGEYFVSTTDYQMEDEDHIILNYYSNYSLVPYCATWKKRFNKKTALTETEAYLKASVGTYLFIMLPYKQYKAVTESTSTLPSEKLSPKRL